MNWVTGRVWVSPLFPPVPPQPLNDKMPTVTFTKSNIARAELFLRRGVISPGLLSQVKAGRTVEVQFRGGKTFTQVQQVTVDGVVRGGVQPVTKAEGPRRPRKAREQFLGSQPSGGPPTTFQRVHTETPAVAVRPGSGDGISTGGLLGGSTPEQEATARAEAIARTQAQQLASVTAIYGKAEVQPGLKPTKGITAADIFGVARRPEFKPITTTVKPFEVKPHPKLPQDQDISIPTFKETALAVGKALIFPTRKGVPEAKEKVLAFEKGRITPGLSKLLGLGPLTARREAARKAQEIAISKGKPSSRFTVAGGKEKFFKDILGIEVGLREAAVRPISILAPEVALGIATGGVFKGAGLVLGRAPLKVTQALATPIGKSVRKVLRTGVTGTFIASEATTISKAKDPFKALGGSALKFKAFTAGIGLTERALTPGIRKITGTPFAELERQELIQAHLTKGGQKFIEPFVKVQRAARGRVEPLPREVTAGRLPKAIPKKARGPIAKLIREEKPVIFGTLGSKLVFPKLRAPKDIDIALKDFKGFTIKAARITGGEVRGQAVGVAGAKFFDIKPKARLEEFGFIERTVTTPSGVRVIRQSEQLARKIGGVIEGRPKDVKDVISLATALEARTLGAKSIVGRIKVPKDFFKPGVKITRPSRKGVSILPSRLPSRLPSKLPSLLPSRVPSKLPSRIPISRVPSKVPSRISKVSGISKVPISKISSILKPSKVPSKIPSELKSSLMPSKVPSKLPSKLPSRLPVSRIPITLLPPLPTTRIPKLRLGFDSLTEAKKKREREMKRVFKFKPSVVAVEHKIRGKRPKRLTGLEVRAIPL